MFNLVLHRRRGSALAFLLMGLIAILAIVVVLLSRARRVPPEPAAAAAGEQAVVTTGTLNEQAVPIIRQQDEPTTSVETGTAESDPAQATPASPEVQLPPPPPSTSVTPDTRNLPPEG